jgi:diguanylate cyclase (GGDEF)-like protein
MQDESIKLARSTSSTLSKSSAAFDKINTLMAEKIQGATETVVNYDGEITQERLVNFAHTLNVEVIYYYNPEGVIIASNTGEYIGWKGEETHPVELFRNSIQTVLVEDIRQDSESGIYYKYGYAKAENGYFVQIGIYAQDVYQSISEFETQSIINELKQDENIVEISIIDKKYLITASSNKSNIGHTVTQERLVNSRNGEIYTSDNGQVYEVFAPVNIDSVNVGFLSIQYSLLETNRLIQNMTFLGFILILSFYLIVIIVIYNSFQKNKQLIKLAFYDSLTSLPNVDYLKYYLEMNLKKEKSVKALILVNCINFKRINMSYGYKEGDYIIQKMANQLKSLEKNKCKVFKFNADRFIVLIEDVDSIDQVILYAKMIETMFIDDDFKPDLQIKMGIVEIEKVKQDVDDILKDAAIALNSINELQSYAVFDADMDKKIHREDQIEHEIKSSIQARDTERIYFHYQPIFDLNTMKIVACEALARLNTKHYGQVAPLEFIDIAEKKQLIVPLGEYLLNEACLMIHQLESEGLNEIKIAVNISGIQVMQDEFVVMVERMIKKHQIDPNQLELEITESVYMQDYESINRKLFHLRELGISISMDDFGTGFSSFYRLKEAYLDILKIDRYFVKSIGINQNDKLISQDIISIGHKYELKCVAEGIENSYQLDNLRKHHCDYGQGYYLSYPLDKDDVIALLHKNLRK